jgi:hypothetical protein
MGVHRNGEGRAPVDATDLHGWLTAPEQKRSDLLSPPAGSLKATSTPPNGNGGPPGPYGCPKPLAGARRTPPDLDSLPEGMRHYRPGLVQGDVEGAENSKVTHGPVRTNRNETRPLHGTTWDVTPYAPLNERTAPHPNVRHSTPTRAGARQREPDSAGGTRTTASTASRLRPDDSCTNRHAPQHSYARHCIATPDLRTLEPSSIVNSRYRTA